MREFDLTDPTIRVRRGVVDALVASFGAYRPRTERVVCRHLGIDAIGDDPDALFSTRRLLSAMAELQQQFGSMRMRQIGSFISDNATLPPGIDAVSAAMERVDEVHHSNHSEDARGRIGGYLWRATGDRSGEMLCDAPYPCAFDVGILQTLAARFEPTAVVTHVPAGCRHDGAKVCIYHVGW